MKKIYLISPVLALFLSLSAAHAFTLSNFDTPESMIADPEGEFYYVSNINGALAEKDGNGYISKISRNGNIIIQKFIGGKKEAPVLNAPKGLVIVDKTLFATDIDAVKGFDKNSGKQTIFINLAPLGAKFLNDITYDKRRYLYVSDTMTNQIFQIDLKNYLKAVLFKEGKELGGPNGLLINPKTRNLMVVTWISGRILEIDHHKDVRVLKKGLTALDGIDIDGDGCLYVSSFEKGEIYKIPKYGRGVISVAVSGLTTPADISLDLLRNEILIPSFKGNSVAVIPKK